MKALLLIGSPKGKAGTSYVLGGALLRRLEARGAEVEVLTVSEALQSTEDQNRLHKALDAADVIVVSFPLYVDQLPAPLIQVFELVADRRKNLPGVTPGAGPLVPRIVAVVQCGFPETHQNGSAVDIMRRFAEESGFRWAGALAMGSGGAVVGRNMERAGGMLRGVVKALDLAAASLAAGGAVPEEATALMAKPLMPRWLYLQAANWGFRRLLKKHGARARRYDRPYA
jgi:hypothetical protein